MIFSYDQNSFLILLGTRLPAPQPTPLPQTNLNNSSTNVFNSKHCVSREQMSNTDLDGMYAYKKDVFVFLCIL